MVDSNAADWLDFGRKTKQVFGFREGRIQLGLDDIDLDILWMASEHRGTFVNELVRLLAMDQNTASRRLQRLENKWYLASGRRIERREYRDYTLKKYWLTHKGQMAALGVLASRPELAAKVSSSEWHKNPLPFFLLPKGMTQQPKGTLVNLSHGCMHEFYNLFYNTVDHNIPLKAALTNCRRLEDLAYLWSAVIIADIDHAEALANKHGLALPPGYREQHDWGARIGALIGEVATRRNPAHKV